MSRCSGRVPSLSLWPTKKLLHLSPNHVQFHGKENLRPSGKGNDAAVLLTILLLILKLSVGQDSNIHTFFIFSPQVSKQGMSNRVVDELNPDMLLTRKDLAVLLDFKDEEAPPPDTR